MTNQIANFPQEVIDKMLYYQEQQGNIWDITVFEENKCSSQFDGGFDYDETPEEDGFWSEVIGRENFNLFFEKYPKKAPQHSLELLPEKVMWVSDYEDMRNKRKRVVFGKKNGLFLAWGDVKTVEEARDRCDNLSWKFAKDIDPEPEYIPFDFSDAEMFMGKSVKRKNSNSDIRMITKCNNRKVSIGGEHVFYDDLLKIYTFLNNTPCGKLKEQ